MADESRYARDRGGRDHYARDHDRDEYRARGREEYRGREHDPEDYGGGWYRGERGHAREARGGWGERGGEYGRGYGYGREGYGYGGPGPGGYRGGRGEERGWWDRTSDEVSSWFGDEEAERRRRMDERRSGAWRQAGHGEHRGRGPAGYTRSDDRIREDVCDRLTDDPSVDASNVEVKVSTGEVTLSGPVSDRWAKRRAEDIAGDVSGVKHVQNNLRVQEGATLQRGQPQAMGGGEGAPTAAFEPGGRSGRTSAA